MPFVPELEEPPDCALVATLDLNQPTNLLTDYTPLKVPGGAFLRGSDGESISKG